jgi:hypothetical protein
VNFQILLTLFCDILSAKALGYPEYSERACNPERMSWQWRLKLSYPWSCIEGIWVYWRYKTSFARAQDQCQWTASCCNCFTPGEISYGSHLIRVPEPVWTIWRRENCYTHSRNEATCPRSSRQSRANNCYTFIHNTDELFLNFCIYADCMFSSNLTLPWITRVKRFVLSQHTSYTCIWLFNILQ